MSDTTCNEVLVSENQRARGGHRIGVEAQTRALIGWAFMRVFRTGFDHELVRELRLRVGETYHQFAGADQVNLKWAMIRSPAILPCPLTATLDSSACSAH